VGILNDLTNRIAQFGLKLKPKTTIATRDQKKLYYCGGGRGEGGVVLRGNFVVHLVGRLVERFVLSCTRSMFRIPVVVVVVVSAPRVFCATASYRTGQCTRFVDKKFPALVENGGQKFPLLRSAPGIGLAAWREQ
jgi:hypothetical protein